MKVISLALISLAALLLINCSPTSTDPNDIVSRLLETRMVGGDFEKQPSGKDTLKYYGPDNLVLIGTSRILNDHLVITIYTEALEMEHGYDIAVYAPDETSKWKPVFAEEVVRGRLDTIIDLNGDQRPEFIVDEYNGNSAGFNSVQLLYARLADSNTYDRIDTLSVRWNGGSAYNIGRAEYEYQRQEDNQTMIVVHREVTDMGEEATAVTAKSIYLLYWQPPYLNREDEDAPPERPAQEVDLDEAQSILDEFDMPELKDGLQDIRYDVDGGELDVLYFDGSLSNLKFRDYQKSEEGGNFMFMHLEFKNNSVVRAIKRIGNEQETAAILFYLKGDEEHIVSLNRHPTELDSWGLPKEMPTTDVPGDEPAAASVNYEFDPENDRHVLFIRENAALFRHQKIAALPGSAYIYDKDGIRYEVDSVLWVKEFVNQ